MRLAPEDSIVLHQGLSLLAEADQSVRMTTTNRPLLELKRALELYGRALDLFTQYGDPGTCAEIQLKLSLCYSGEAEESTDRTSAELEQAIHHARNAENYFQDNRDSNTWPFLLAHLGL